MGISRAGQIKGAKKGERRGGGGETRDVFETINKEKRESVHTDV